MTATTKAAAAPAVDQVVDAAPTPTDPALYCQHRRMRDSCEDCAAARYTATQQAKDAPATEPGGFVR